MYSYRRLWMWLRTASSSSTYTAARKYYSTAYTDVYTYNILDMYMYVKVAWRRGGYRHVAINLWAINYCSSRDKRWSYRIHHAACQWPVGDNTVLCVYRLSVGYIRVPSRYACWLYLHCMFMIIFCVTSVRFSKIQCSDYINNMSLYKCLYSSMLVMYSYLGIFVLILVVCLVFIQAYALWSAMFLSKWPYSK